MNSPHDLYLYLLMASAVLLILLTGIILAFAHLLKTIRKKEHEKLQAILMAEQHEREALAKELHDNLGPILSIAQLQLGYLSEQPTTQNTQTLVPHLYQQLQQAAKLSRDLSHQLSPLPDQPQALQTALKNHIQHIHASNQLRVTLQYSHDLNPTPQAAGTLHRILQELLHNTLKHAQAKNAQISLTQDQQNTYLKYSDDGIGIQPQNLYQGLGTRNIHSRVKAMNGKLHYKEQQPKLEVHIQLPRKFKVESKKSKD